MPTYEYECTKCGHRFERFQSMSDPPVKTCPECRGKVKRLIGTGAGIIFKGEGFYITDYRSKDYKEKAGKDRPPADTPKSDSSSSDAKTPKPGKAEKKKSPKKP